MIANTDLNLPPQSTVSQKIITEIFEIYFTLGLNLSLMEKSSHLFFKQLRFRQLHALVELSRQRNFSATAQALDLSVVSAWRQVRALEEQFGVELVLAKGSQTELTEDGHMLAEMARPLVEGFLSLPKVFADRQQDKARELTLSAPATIISEILPDPLKKYRRLHPHVGLRIMELPSRSALEAVLAGTADLALIGSNKAGSMPSSVDSRLLARFPIQLLCPHDHPLASAKRLTVKQIARHPLVLSGEETADRSQINQAFGNAGVLDKLTVTISATRMELIARYVAMDFGVALLAPGPEDSSVLKHHRNLVWRDVSRLFGHEDIVLIQVRGRFELPHVHAFRELVSAAFHER